jgi:hypothetical protein
VPKPHAVKHKGLLVIEDKIQAFGIGSQFRVYDDKIKTPGDG